MAGPGGDDDDDGGVGFPNALVPFNELLLPLFSIPIGFPVSFFTCGRGIHVDKHATIAITMI